MQSSLYPSFNTSFYPELVMSYLSELPNAGTLEVNNKTVYRAQAGSISKTVKIDLYIKIDNDIIKQVKYLVYGNGYIIAALGRLSEELIGLKTHQVANYSMNKLADNLEIPIANRAKLQLIKMCLESIIEQYKAFNKSN